MPDSLSFSTLFGTSRENADLVRIATNAVRAGYAVLPVEPGGKKPLCILTENQRRSADKKAALAARDAGFRGWMNIRHSNSGECGVHHAITDDKVAQRVFKRLYEEHPDLNIAIEVGRSRVLCIDADNAADVTEFTSMWAEEAGVPQLRNMHPTVRSPGKIDVNGEWTHKNGGHFHFYLPDDVDFSNAPTADPLKFGGAVCYFKDRVLLVPPSVREEGPYVLNSDILPAPVWLIEAVQRHIDGNVERRKIQRDKVHADGDPIDVWSVDTPWAELLEPDGWNDAARFESCGCACWTRPGPASNPKSLTAHELGCTRWDLEQGHGFAHVWTDDPPQWLRDYIDATGSRSLSKLQWVAWRDHGGDIKAAMAELGLNAIVERTSPWDLIDPSDEDERQREATTDPKGDGDVAVPVDEVTEEALAGLRARMYKPGDLEAIPPPVWLIKGWFTRDSIGRMSGSPGSWKSFVALDVALHIASGTEWYGHRVKQGKVLYIAAEGVSGIKKRIQAWRVAHPDIVLPEENMIVLSGAVYAARPEEWAELCAVNQEDQYIMIILDTQARITAGMDENDNSEMSLFVRRMDVLRQQAGSFVLAVHHTGHDGKRGRGASSMWGALDTELFLDRDKEKNTAELKFLKSKDSSEDETLTFTAIEHSLGEDEDGDPITSLSIALAEPGGPTEGSIEWWIEALDHLGLPNNATVRVTWDAIRKRMNRKFDQNDPNLKEAIKRRKNRGVQADGSSGTEGEDHGEAEGAA